MCVLQFFLFLLSESPSTTVALSQPLAHEISILDDTSLSNELTRFRLLPNHQRKRWRLDARLSVVDTKSMQHALLYFESKTSVVGKLGTPAHVGSS